MTAKIIDGREAARRLNGETARRVSELKKTHGRAPGLAAVLVGEDPASRLYVANKRKACESAGIYSELHNLPADCEEEELVVLLNNLNADDKIDGILVQLPLPAGLRKQKILDEIAVEKDVDGLSTTSMGKLVAKEECFAPATAKSVMHLIRQTGVEVPGKNVVVVGESVLIGRPVSFFLLNEWCTVTTCHKHTKDLGEITRKAEILVSAVGKPSLIRREMVGEGAIVVDVGISELPGEGGKRKIVGDVDFEQVSQVASWITPVPGGVGPVTVEMLLKNTLEAFEKKV